MSNCKWTYWFCLYQFWYIQFIYTRTDVDETHMSNIINGHIGFIYIGTYLVSVGYTGTDIDKTI
jgi:hypothetical protein